MVQHVQRRLQTRNDTRRFQAYTKQVLKLNEWNECCARDLHYLQGPTHLPADIKTPKKILSRLLSLQGAFILQKIYTNIHSCIHSERWIVAAFGRNCLW